MARHYCGTCAYCERPAVCNGTRSDAQPGTLMCVTHYARWRKGIPMTAPVRSYRRGGWDRLAAACDAREAAETDYQAKLADERVRAAALAYAKERLGVSP